MTRQEAKRLCGERVTALGGVKATALVADPELTDLVRAGFDLPDLLDELRAEGGLVEVEYCLPDMPWRVKSFYLPAGTHVIHKESP